MKKFLAVAVSAFMVLGAVGCGGGEEAAPPADEKEEVQEEAEEGFDMSEVDIYQAILCIEGEEEYDCEDDVLFIEPDGNGFFAMADKNYDFTWELNEDIFIFTDVSGDTFTGQFYDEFEGVENALVGLYEMDIDGEVIEYTYLFQQVLPPEEGETETADSGDLIGKYMFMGSDVFGNGELTDPADFGETWFELKDNGKFEIMLDGRPGDGKYTVNGTDLVLDWAGIEYVGTVEPGHVALDINTVMFHFGK